jgi:hypothetical protein
MLIWFSWTWQHLQIWHTLDMMHIEKNICENVVRFILAKKTQLKYNETWK